MRDFISAAILVIMVFGLSMVSCENSENTSELSTDIVFLKSVRMPIVGGAGVRGMKIVLNVEKKNEVQLDSIVYNGRSGEISEMKKVGNGGWVESYFYDSKEMVEGKGWLEYKAEGNTCILYYRINEKTNSILIPNLELKQANTDILWE